jgi:hypothetical protein
MILLLVGALIAALGLYSGRVLVLAPLGVVPWVASPILCVAGVLGGIGTAAHSRTDTANA